MKAPELVLRPNATRRVPGVNTPVAAPNWAWALVSVAICCSVRPAAAGNLPAVGCSAWASPGAGVTAAGVEAVDGVEVAAVEEADALEELELDEDPHPASASASAPIRARSPSARGRRRGMACGDGICVVIAFRSIRESGERTGPVTSPTWRTLPANIALTGSCVHRREQPQSETGEGDHH